MNKKKIIASAALTTCLCASLIAGATYALFTSEDTVNIAVTSGKVNVTATVDNLKTYSFDREQSAGSFENGGFASIDGGKLTIDRITPGDKATFDIKIVNNSNVTIQYQVNYKAEFPLTNYPLSDVLDVTIESESVTLGEWSAWAIPTAPAEKEKTLSVSVEMPKDAGNEYQGKSVDLVFAVNAVQGNAAVTNDSDTNGTVLAHGALDFTDEEATSLATCPVCYNEKTDANHAQHHHYFKLENGVAYVNNAENGGGAYIANSVDFTNAAYTYTVEYDLSQLSDTGWAAFNCGQNKPAYTMAPVGFKKVDGNIVAYNVLKEVDIKDTTTYKTLTSDQVTAVYTFEEVDGELVLTLTLNGEKFVVANKVAPANEIFWCVYYPQAQDNETVAIKSFTFTKYAKVDASKQIEGDLYEEDGTYFIKSAQGKISVTPVEIEGETQEGLYVAESGEYYAVSDYGLKAAFYAVQENGTVSLANDFTFTHVGQLGDKNDTYITKAGVTLDLNGHTLEMAKGGQVQVLGLAASGITLKNGTVKLDSANGQYALYVTSGAQDVKIENVTVLGGMQVVGNSTATLTNVNVTAADKYYCVYLEYNSTVTIESGNFTSNGQYAHLYTAYATDKVIVNGGTFTGDVTLHAGNGTCTDNR